MRRIIMSVLVVATLGLLPPAGHAYCLVLDVHEAFKKAEAVFIGIVADIVPPRTDDESAPYSARLYTVTFIVEDSFKGNSSPQITLLTNQGGRGCFDWKGGPFVKGMRYLVYADPFLPENGTRPAVLSCSNRTNSLSDVVADLKPLADIRQRESMSLSFDYSFRPFPGMKSRKEGVLDSWFRDN